MSDYDDTAWRAKQAENAKRASDEAAVEAAVRLRGIIAADKANQRSNPALKDQYVPERFTSEQEAEYVTKTFGDDETRIAAVIAELNARN